MPVALPSILGSLADLRPSHYGVSPLRQRPRGVPHSADGRISLHLNTGGPADAGLGIGIARPKAAKVKLRLAQNMIGALDRKRLKMFLYMAVGTRWAQARLVCLGRVPCAASRASDDGCHFRAATTAKAPAPHPGRTGSISRISAGGRVSVCPHPVIVKPAVCSSRCTSTAQ